MSEHVPESETELDGPDLNPDQAPDDVDTRPRPDDGSQDDITQEPEFEEAEADVPDDPPVPGVDG